MCCFECYGANMRLSTVNKAISQYGYELIKMPGYFYFWPLTNDIKQLYDDSVMTNTLGKDLNFWILELEYKIKCTRY